MTDVEYHRSRYDVPKKKGFMGVSYPVLIVCLMVVSILFALLIFFVQQSKFKLKEFNYVDESVEVELVEPVPPPPPPLPAGSGGSQTTPLLFHYLYHASSVLPSCFSLYWMSSSKGSSYARSPLPSISSALISTACILWLS